MFLKLTSNAGRVRERTAGKGNPRETTLILSLSFFEPEPVARRLGPE